MKIDSFFKSGFNFKDSGEDPIFKLKVGHGKYNENRFELFGYTQASETGMGVNYSFLFNKDGEKWFPFIKIGIGAGKGELGTAILDFSSMEESEDIWNFNSTFGLGVYYNLSEKMEISMGLDYTYKQWDGFAIDPNNPNIELENNDKMTSFIIGLNYRF